MNSPEVVQKRKGCSEKVKTFFQKNASLLVENASKCLSRLYTFIWDILNIFAA
jgi:hypothetical protein